MSARTLANLAYAYLTEHADQEGVEKVNATLEQADRALRVMRRRLHGEDVPRVEMTEAEVIAERARRMLRAVPDQSRQLAASMAQFARTPGDAR